MRKTGPTNEHLVALIQSLRKASHTHEAGIWKSIAVELEKPARSRRAVNVSRINRFTKANETVIVPGKVLGAGAIDHSVVVAAFSFSSGAKEQIKKANGKAITIPELLKQNPKGKDVRIIG